MSKSLKRHRVADSDEYSDHKVKVMKRREVERKLAALDEEYYKEEVPEEYMNDPKFYRAIKNYR